MMKTAENVLPLWRNGFPVRDIDLIETMLLMATGGDEVPIDEVERSHQTLEAMSASFGRGPDMELRGMALPVVRWQFPLQHKTVELFVVDCGGYRAFHYRTILDTRARPPKCDVRR